MRASEKSTPGISAPVEGDIKAYAGHGSKGLERPLKLKVYLHGLNGYKDINKTYTRHFDGQSPVRTAVAVYGGVPPGNSSMEIDSMTQV